VKSAADVGNRVALVQLDLDRMAVQKAHFQHTFKCKYRRLLVAARDSTTWPSSRRRGVAVQARIAHPTARDRADFLDSRVRETAFPKQKNLLGSGALLRRECAIHAPDLKGVQRTASAKRKEFVLAHVPAALDGNLLMAFALDIGRLICRLLSVYSSRWA